MLHAAISRQDSYALTAIELIASINRQGLIHPKECAGVLVSLETSSNPAIARIAFDTHKMLHQQYESMFDREYMRAVQDAFYYQRDVVGDPTGALVRPFTSKLAPLFEIVKISSSKYQKKFLSNLCSKVDFEPKKLDVSGNPPEHLLLARFICQNLAFFEYGQVAELLPTIVCMERIVSATGTVVAHAIETELFPARIQSTTGETNSIPSRLDGPPHDYDPATADPGALKQLATAAGALSILWETRSYLRRLYGISFYAKQKEGKTNSKELSKTPTKVHGVNGDRFWEAVSRIMGCLDNADAMMYRCREFATLLSIDDELKVTADDDRESYDTSGDMDGATSGFMGVNGSKPTKRKGSLSASGTPKKSKARIRSSNTKKRASTDLEEVRDFD